MQGYENDLIDKTLSMQIEQIKSCRISINRKGNRKNIKISRINSQLILKFLDECLIMGLSKNRMLFYVCRFKKLLQMTKKDFDKMGKDDLKDMVRIIETSNYKDWTKQCYKITIKKFFQSIKGCEWNSKEYPEEVSWIKIVSRNSKRLPEEILTYEEIEKMVKNASNLRDKAFIFVLYESGARISEIMGLKIKHVSFDKDGAVIIVNGKTGSRRIRLVLSASKLVNWIENSPSKANRESYVWTNLEKDGKPLSYKRVSNILREVARKASVKKRVNPHSFRHSRATHLSKHLPDAVMKSYFGWTQSSKMASVYYHLSGADVDSAILGMYGKKSEEKENMISLKSCPRCGSDSSPESDFCCKCGLPLGIEYVDTREKDAISKEIHEIKEEMNKIRDTERKFLQSISPEMIEEMIEEKVKELLEKH
jgi:site-specific recombinase XerD